MRRPRGIQRLSFQQELDLLRHYLWLVTLPLLIGRETWGQIDGALFSSSKIAYKYTKGEVYATDRHLARLEKKGAAAASRFRDHPSILLLDDSKVESERDVRVIMEQLASPVAERLLRSDIHPQATRRVVRQVRTGWSEIRDVAIRLDPLDSLAVVLALLREKDFQGDDDGGAELTIETYEALLRVVQDPQYRALELFILYAVDTWVGGLRPQVVPRAVIDRAQEVVQQFERLDFTHPIYMPGERSPIMADMQLNTGLDYALRSLWHHIRPKAGARLTRPVESFRWRRSPKGLRIVFPQMAVTAPTGAERGL